MNLFRLTYFIANKHTKDKRESLIGHEIYGGPDAIVSTYLALKGLEELANQDKYESAYPRFFDILNKDGVSCLKAFEKYGTNGLSNCNTFS